MTDESSFEALTAHLKDLEENSQKWHKVLCSAFLNEEELAAVQPLFPESSLIHYDGGYPDARKKKIIFFAEEGDDFSDVICLQAKIDQRFRQISHRDILGAVMHLQVERSSFGDFWIADDSIYFYTSEGMADFFTANLTQINQLHVQFHRIQEHPVQVFKTKKIHCVAASSRLDALVAALTRTSRSKAKDMIRAGLVQINHASVEQADKLCNNNDTISIRGTGRFTYLGESHETKSGRIAAEFLQYI